MGLSTWVTYIHGLHKRTPGDRSLNIEKLIGFIDTTETNKAGNLSASKQIRKIAEKVYKCLENVNIPS